MLRLRMAKSIAWGLPVSVSGTSKLPLPLPGASCRGNCGTNGTIGSQLSAVGMPIIAGVCIGVDDEDGLKPMVVTGMGAGIGIGIAPLPSRPHGPDVLLAFGVPPLTLEVPNAMLSPCRA